MINTANMSPAFETEKNIKAAVYTTIVCVLLFLVFFFTKWTLPQIPPPPFEEGIEVNLGNSETGLGDIAPEIPGEPSPTVTENVSIPAPSSTQPQDQNITGDENETDEAPVINKVPPVKVKNDLVKNVPVVKSTTTSQSTVAAIPAPPKPKAIYSGGTGTNGGNGGDSYNNVRNQGIAGGQGDQGSANGNPNSDSYTGNGGTGNSGVRIKSGLNGRRFTRLPSFTDDFNENAKVAVDIKVDKTGNVITANVNPRGTTTTNSGIRAIAIRKAMQLKLNPGDEDEQSGTILFEFKLRG